MHESEFLTQALTENNLHISAEAKQQLLRYLTLLATWNRIFNLTTITKPRDKVYLHIIDSLVIQSHLQGTRFLDVGSGAGLPGIPLAIANPLQHWVLLDKNSKKTRFLTQVVAELGLANVEVIHARAGDFHPRHCFDSILSRALGTIRMFVGEAEHLIGPQGLLIAMKGKYPEEELQDVPNRFQVQIKRIDIKGIDVERHIVCLRRKED